MNIAIAVAVVVLYVLFFTGNRKAPAKFRAGNATETNTDFTKSIYYINFDTVLANYDMYLDMETQIQNDAKTAEADLRMKESQFQKEVTDYQAQMQKGLLLRSEAQQIEQNLGNKQQQLLQLQENLRADLAEKQMVFNRKILDKIMVYLDEVQPEYNYHIVLGTSFGGGFCMPTKISISPGKS
ncbi:MAG: OmpH family outer membrane protein [Bacteroidales bacterium]|nr:OmpH family outer membrane protein [Bacteroidales bacterium]